MFNLKGNKAENHITILWYLDELRNNLIIGSSLNRKHYTKEDEESVIKSIFEKVAFDNIIVIKESNQYRLLDGEKRLVSINDFIDGKIAYNNQYYNDLPQDLKDAFLGYYLTIVVL